MTLYTAMYMNPRNFAFFERLNADLNICYFRFQKRHLQYLTQSIIYYLGYHFGLIASLCRLIGPCLCTFNLSDNKTMSLIWGNISYNFWMVNNPLLVFKSL